MHRTTRRGVLQAGAAAAGVAIASRAWPAKSAEIWDLIVVGGGNAGLPTAIFAAQRGARVLVLEAAGQVGGTLFLSSGQMSAAGTRLQRERGILEDTPQSHYDDVMRIAGGSADPTLLRLAVEQAAPAFDWLTERGFRTHPGHPVTGTTHDPYTHARYAWAPGGGKAILAVLNAELEPLARRARVRVLTQTEAVELLQRPDGAITGVAARSAQGTTSRHFARQVALTCGGYTANPEMFEKLEGAKTWSRATYPFSRGAGIDLGVAAGGYVRGGDKHTPLFGAVLADRNFPTPIRALVRHFPPERPPFEILVNAAGRRFVCEDVASHDAFEQSLRAQSEERCWVVFDAAMRRAAPPLVRGGIDSPFTEADVADAFELGLEMFFRADSLRALAQAAGIEPEGLLETVALYNRAQRRGVDTLGRRHMPLPLIEAPFYAIELRSWNLTSYAGLAVDERLRVIRADGRIVPNLYAAGELLGMGQLMGRAVCGGMSVTPALALGRMLGRELLRV